jgi:hypothetical protein
MNNPHIGVFIKYLNQLSSLIAKVESETKGNTELLDAQLTDDMFPFYTQAEIAIGFSVRACCPIAGVERVSFANESKSYSALKKQIEKTIECLLRLDNRHTDITVGTISDMAGPVELQLPTYEYLHSFAFPNFFFHLSMVYAIARAEGIPISKGDFDGYHEYPIGFSFEK